MGMGATLITFSPSTTIKSADVNSNFSALNNALSPSFTTLTVTSTSSLDNGLLTTDGNGNFVKVGQYGGLPVSAIVGTAGHIEFGTNVEAKGALAAPAAITTAATAAGTNLGVGTYQYVVTFYSDDGETIASAAKSITTTSSNTNVNLSGIPTSADARAIGRKIYRTKLAGSIFYLLTTIANQSATTYSDSATDASLSATVSPAANTFGGSFIAKDTSGNISAMLSNDGRLSIRQSNKLMAGNQETGQAAAGSVSSSTGGGQCAGPINFKSEMTNPPSSITLTTSSSSNFSSNVVIDTNIYGTTLVTTMSGTNVTSRWSGTYTTVGNCIIALNEALRSFDHHCDARSGTTGLECGNIRRGLSIDTDMIIASFHDDVRGTIYGLRASPCTACGSIEHFVTTYGSKDEISQNHNPVGQQQILDAQPFLIRRVMSLLGLPVAA